MTNTSPNPVALWWIRRDLRLTDAPALVAAAQAGAVVPVFIRDAQVDRLGAAAKLRLDLSLRDLQRQLAALGSRLILRSGPALETLRTVIRDTGASALYWERLIDPEAIERDTKVKAALKDDGVVVESCPANLLVEPWKITTKTGGFYKVFSPYWNTVQQIDIARPVAVPPIVPLPAWPASENLKDWALYRAMDRARDIVSAHQRVGEHANWAHLQAFGQSILTVYKDKRDFLADHVTSGLGDALALGEVSARAVWHHLSHNAQATPFLRQLAWRDFAYHLLYHTPHLATDNWRDGWTGFPWRTKPDNPDLIAWQRGLTGIDVVDAAMRELWVTGRMHNRARMLTASVLTKHLLVDWRLGAAWFADTLTDWDPANNAMGWQWVAGCGPDASPYFRIFNPDTQAQKFDADGQYRQYWLDPRSRGAQAFYAAIPQAWGMSDKDPRPKPIVGLSAGRQRALEAYEAMRAGL